MKARPTRRLFFLAWWAIAIFCFALGFGLTRPWYWELGVLACALVWLFAGRAYPSVGLGVSVFIAALGILVSAPVELMILGASASLALWSFATVVALAKEGDASAMPSFALTLLALGLGTAIAILGPALNLRLPFFAVLLCVIVLAISVDQLVSAIRRTRRPSR